MSPNEFSRYLESVRRLSDEILIPAEPEMVRNRSVPARALTAMKELGLFGITIPGEYGGLELTPVQQALVTMEVTRASLVYRSRFSTNIGLCAHGLLAFGTNERAVAISLVCPPNIARFYAVLTMPLAETRRLVRGSFAFERGVIGPEIPVE